MFFEGQDLVRKELVKWFPSTDFAWTDNIFLEGKKDENEHEEEGQSEENSIDWVFIRNVVDIEILM